MKNIFNPTKKAAKDYTLAMLPQTRKAVFFDVLKLNWKKFVLYGLLFFAVCLPLQLVTLSEAAAVIRIQYAEHSQEQIPYMTAITRIIASIIKIPCLLLIAVAISGFVRVIRQYAWMENVNFLYEFRQGVKTNVLQILLVALFAGIANIFATFFITVAETASDFFSSMIVLTPAAIVFLYLIPVFGYMVVSISIYKSKLGSHFQVGRLLYAQSFWKTLLAMLCCFSPFALQAVPVFICQLLGAVLSPLISPVVFLGWYLFTLNGLDEYINPQNYPSLVGKGLYDPQST